MGGCMIRRLFHGSQFKIEKPVFGGGKPYNDYGRGFYCTEQLDMAMEWAVGRDRDGYANEYELECDGLDILDLNLPEYGILSWLSILLENREFDIPSGLAMEAKEYLLAHFLPSYQKRDAIIGYRADDSYFSFAQDFINGTISLRQLGRAMHLGKLGLQFVLKSRTAFDRITFVGRDGRRRTNGIHERAHVIDLRGESTLTSSAIDDSPEISIFRKS